MGESTNQFYDHVMKRAESRKFESISGYTHIKNLEFLDQENLVLYDRTEPLVKFSCEFTYSDNLFDELFFLKSKKYLLMTNVFDEPCPYFNGILYIRLHEIKRIFTSFANSYGSKEYVGIKDDLQIINHPVIIGSLLSNHMRHVLGSGDENYFTYLGFNKDDFTTLFVESARCIRHTTKLVTTTDEDFYFAGFEPYELKDAIERWDLFRIIMK